MKHFFRTGIANGLLSALIVIATWQLVASGNLISQSVLPTPADILELAGVELLNGRLAENIRISAVRLVYGFLIGGLLGALVGAALGIYKTARLMFFPLLETLRPIPPLAWVPLALIWFGVGEPSKVFLIALTAFFPVFITSMKGVQNIDPQLIRAALSLDVSHKVMFRSVILPAALPDIVTGLRLGWSMGLIALVGAEMIASDSGLGHMIMEGMNQARSDFVIFGILVIGILNILTDALFVRFSQSRLLRWHQSLNQHEK